MTVPELLQFLPQMREWFPQPIVMEWSLAEYLKGEQQQRAATWKGLNAWRQSTVLDKNAMVFNEKINYTGTKKSLAATA